ncbi:MAG: hypothetical protein HC871_14510 [Rhizobiales bacterium]|nr:hypothetical protein [Hyphomicrobiales bacterium]
MTLTLAHAYAAFAILPLYVALSAIDPKLLEAARDLGATLAANLMEDSKTTSRWYIVVAMGRHAGFLALGIGKAAGATLTLIPEEFQERPVRLSTVADILAGAIIKRLSRGREDGVAVLAEGIAEVMNQDDLTALASVTRDEHGHVELADLDLGRALKEEVLKRLAPYGLATAEVVPLFATLLALPLPADRYPPRALAAEAMASCRSCPSSSRLGLRAGGQGRGKVSKQVVGV